ncbi:hypothetical protein HPB49_023720 [Dermacentor silvarum]|uniref:Uncharacterized protein n=1 Tax=Dermacentor silvarum TaxID=543639 RepID=A0ACB8DGX8_DERSI|nr:hypothetical protein HPB49_023720 [Dermacentor silvarum]
MLRQSRPKHIDVRQQRGRVGHCKDVCPTSTIKTWLVCGLVNTKADHRCTPKCRTPAAVGERFPATRQAASCAKVKDPIEEPRPKLQRQQLLQDKPQQEKVTITSARGWVNAAKRNNIRNAQKTTEATKKDDMHKVQGANETIRHENAALRTIFNNRTKEIAEIRKLFLCNNEPLQIPTPSTSKTAETTKNTQETAIEEPAPKKRAVEATRKQTENDRISNLEAKFAARFTKLEQLITANIAAVTALKQTMETYQAENRNRFAYIERTLQPIVSHPDVLGALERQGPSEPATASGDPRRVKATP